MDSPLHITDKETLGFSGRIDAKKANIVMATTFLGCTRYYLHGYLQIINGEFIGPVQQRSEEKLSAFDQEIMLFKIMQEW